MACLNISCSGQWQLTERVLMASSYRRDAERPIKLGRFATLEPDGTLHLPPIVQPKAEDPFANSKFLKYNLARQKEAQLRKIVSVFRYFFSRQQLICLSSFCYDSNNWVKLSRVYSVRLARHITGHFGDDQLSKSLDWCKTPKTKYNHKPQQHKNLNNHARELLAYAQQHKLNQTKPNFGLEAFHAVWPGHGSGLFSSRFSHG